MRSLNGWDETAPSVAGLTHQYTDDLNFLLVGPDGKANLEFFSNITNAKASSNVNVIIADSGAFILPNDDALVSGTTYRPADYFVEEQPSDFGSTVPMISHAYQIGSSTFASTFGGGAPNGAYTLFAYDKFLGDVGSISAWRITVTTSSNLVSLTGTSGGDTLTVTATSPSNGSYVLNGGPAVQYTGLSSLAFAGASGGDTFSGGFEKDTVKGGGDFDTLSGGGGDDRLQGGSGGDILKGDAGADRIGGGGGADDLYGGADDDKDTFAFHKGDSGAGGKSTWDFIYDFDAHKGREKIWDRIDLSAIDADKGQKHDQKFRFVDHFSKAEGKEPDGQVMAEDAGKNVKVLIDVNGDKDADMILLVMHVDHLHRADFIL